MKKLNRITVVLVGMALLFGNTAVFASGTDAIGVAPYKDVNYQTHVQDIGWQGWKTNGDVSGTSNQSKRLEAIKINVGGNQENLGIRYQTHIQDIGWQDWKYDGELSGTEGLGKRLEAIKIELTGSDTQRCDVYYRVHAQNIGWLDWARNGEQAGTAKLSYRLEAIEIVILPKGDIPVSYQGKSSFIDHIDAVSDTSSNGFNNWNSTGGWSGIIEGAIPADSSGSNHADDLFKDY